MFKSRYQYNGKVQMCLNDSEIIVYDRRIPELFNAPFYTEQEEDSMEYNLSKLTCTIVPLL